MTLMAVRVMAVTVVHSWHINCKSVTISNKQTVTTYITSFQL